MSESLSIKTTIQSKSGSSSPLSKTKKDDSGLNSNGPVSSSLLSERQTAKSNSLHLPHLQQGSPSLYRNAYALNNPSLIENPSAVATLLNLSRRGSGRQSAAATYSDTLNLTQDKNSTLGGISSDRESPSSSSSTACTTSSGYPRPKRSKRSENNDDSETNEELESEAMTKVQKMDKDKEDYDIDENFLGEVKQEPMSPQGVSPPRSDPSTMEASFSSNSISLSSAPLTRNSARTKLKNEWPKLTDFPTLQAFKFNENAGNSNYLFASSNGEYQNIRTATNTGSSGLLLFLANPVVENHEDRNWLQNHGYMPYIKKH